MSWVDAAVAAAPIVRDGVPGVVAERAGSSTIRCMTGSASDLPPRRPAVLVLASGRGERFLASGGATHKLQADLAGRPVLQHTLQAVRDSGLPWHLEDGPHPGMGDSIAAAVRATPDAGAWLVLPGDLPLVRSDTLLAIATALLAHEVVVPVYQGRRGHPVGFGRTCLQALTRLQGERGAAPVVAAFGPCLLPVDDVGVVTDIDTLSDLQLAEALLAARRRGAP